MLGAADVRIVHPSVRSLKTARWVHNDSVVSSVKVMGL